MNDYEKNYMNLSMLTKEGTKIENNNKSSNFELLRVFDSEYNSIGISTRYLCHRLGLYHEVIK